MTRALKDPLALVRSSNRMTGGSSLLLFSIFNKTKNSHDSFTKRGTKYLKTALHHLFFLKVQSPSSCWAFESLGPSYRRHRDPPVGRKPPAEPSISRKLQEDGSFRRLPVKNSKFFHLPLRVPCLMEAFEYKEPSNPQRGGAAYCFSLF